MKLFTINNDGKFIPYKERNFEKIKYEEDLEVMLEDNPEYFFERNDVLVIGRQVTTNLNTSIDLLGIDKTGDTVVIELKRGKTPRETVAQLLEYASFVENLDYSQLNDIYQNYSGEESSLEDYHQQYFQDELAENVSFNKALKLVIVAQIISKEIRQTALFLRKKGFDIYCMEFKYFETKSGEKIISSDFVVGEEEFMRQQVKSAALPKINEKQFLNSLDKNGLGVFQQIFEFAKQKNLLFRWGSKGFSLNVNFDNDLVPLFFGYPPNSAFKQSIYTGNELISKKVKDADDIIEFYMQNLRNLKYFNKTGSIWGALRWTINKSYSESEAKQFLAVIEKVISKIKERGLNE